MKINKKLAKEMFTLLEEEKQVSRLAFTEAKFFQWCHTINHIGGLNHRVKTLGDYLLSDFQLPQAMKEMAMPRKVSLIAGDEYVNLKKNDVYKAEDDFGNIELLDAPEFCSVSKGIVNSKRKSGATMVGMDSATEAQLVSSLNDRICCDETHCLREDKIYVPIILDFCPVEEEFLGTKNEVMFKLWFKSACDAISGSQQG